MRETADKWIAIVRVWAEIACMSADAVKLQVRMDRSLKEEAEEVFAEMGLDTTTAVRIFFTKVAKTRSIPFQLKAEPEFTPEQEYYIGRTVGAVIVNKYRPYNNEAANQYLNQLGQTLAQFSDRPETFGGYHFLMMESNDINAFSAPGGLIFISRGMLNCCKNEDALAAVLAHEIGHVQYQHGLKAIKNSRLNSAFTILATESAKQFGGQDLKDLTEAFEGSINDITSTMMNTGYARSCEREADKSAVEIMKRSGYNPNGLVAMLQEMKKNLKPGGLDFAKTHPSPDSRIEDIISLAGPYQPVPAPAKRQARFDRACAPQ